MSSLTPDLSAADIVRYSINDIPPSLSASVQSSVNDINNHVGFWGNEPDFRITERLNVSFQPFSDLELEAVFEDHVNTWSEYQTNVALRAIYQNENADLVVVYSEQPDGSEHQCLLVDLRQATNPQDPSSILGHQDQKKDQAL